MPANAKTLKRFGSIGIRLMLAAVFTSLLAAKSNAWPGFDYNTWLQISHAQPPQLHTPQAGRADLVPVLSADGGTTITTPAGWEAKRARILKNWQAMLGEPTNLQHVPPTAKEIDRFETPIYTRIHLMIAADQETSIPAYLFIPKPATREPLPAVIALHQTVAQGKDEPAGINMSYNLPFALELAQRGFVTIAYDAPGYGERIPPGATPYTGAHDFYRRHPNWSYFGRMVWDFRQIVDYLQTLPQVDPKRIGVIGHSHGGYGSLLGAAFDSRIAATVSSCGFNTLRADPVTDRWSHLTPLMPRLGFFADDIKEAPIDWHELVACIAPRPLYYFGTLSDKIFPNTDGIPGVFDQIRGVYNLYGEPDALHLHMVPGPHGFPIDRQEIAYEWLAKTLKLPARHSSVF